MSLYSKLKIIGIALIAFLVCVHYYFTPDYVSQLKFKDQIISIVRDEYGIPTIKAQTINGAAYALGYAKAQDRLFQMHMKRMIANGRVSEMMGRKALPIDHLFRQLGIGYLAQQTEAKLTVELRQYFSAFSAGINQYVRNNHLPLQFYIINIDFQEWKIKDSLSISKLLDWSQSGDLPREFLRSLVLSKYDKQYADRILPYTEQHFISSDYVLDDEILKEFNLYSQSISANIQLGFVPSLINNVLDLGIIDFLYGKQGSGSNSWVISGNLTQSGYPLLANDPHLDNAFPSQWYQARLEVNHTGKVRKFDGAFIAGAINIGIGKTDYLAWGCTTNYIDNQDLYRQTVEGDKYFYEGQWRNLKIRQEFIKIQGEQLPQKYLVRSTHRGPLVSKIMHQQILIDVNETLSIIWGGFHSNIESLDLFIRITDVQTIEDIRILFKDTNNLAPVNFLYITKDKHIGYQTFGYFPIRNHQNEGAYVKDGTVSRYDWKGYLQTALKPRVIDPSRGFIVSGNQKTASKNYIGGFYNSNNGVSTARGSRIKQLLQQKLKKGKLSIQDSLDIQKDTVDIFCRRILPHLLNTSIKKYLKNWNCNFTADSYQATIYQVFFIKLQNRLKPVIQGFNLPLEGSPIYSHYVYHYMLNTYGDRQETIIEESINEALLFILNFFNTENHLKWRWGQLHRDHLPHKPFSKTPLKFIFDRYGEGRGNQNTPYQARMDKLREQNYNLYHKPNLRFLFSYVQGESRWIIDAGVSSNIFSKHYDDQLKMLWKDQYILLDQQIGESSAQTDL